MCAKQTKPTTEFCEFCFAFLACLKDLRELEEFSVFVNRSSLRSFAFFLDVHDLRKSGPYRWQWAQNAGGHVTCQHASLISA